MSFIRKVVLVSALALILGGCVINSAKPQAFIGTYGEFADDWSVISKVVKEYGFDTRRIEVDPPSDATASVVIHGLSDSAESAAESIARDLQLKLGVPFQVRPTVIGRHSGSVGNHSYSDIFLGVYVMADTYAETAVANVQATYKIVASNEYIAQCDQFAGSLTLFDDGRFNLSGTLFDRLGSEKLESVTGEYFQSPDRLELKLQDGARQYITTKVESSYEQVVRMRLQVVDSVPMGVSALDCNFLQDLAVVSTH